jgi:RNA polymerase sigma factor (sigma-70 family)
MSSVRARKWHQDLETIFGGGALSALSDGQLVELFLGRRAEAGEQAFGALVERHGPMVYRVCGQVLGDSHEAQDAFQAVFIVLARKAGAVRNRESLASWLYGVALRVAARARTDMKRRRARERQTEDGHDEIPAPTAEAPRHTDDAEAVHQEVGRLAQKYRAPIVLCYLQGLTHNQAAARLGWPVGTVRSRLARARDQLRVRLVRRGVTVPAALGPLAGWLGFQAAGIADAATMAATTFSALPAELLAMTIRSACHLADGKAATVALFSSTAFSLSRGVLKTMALEKLATLAWSVLPAGILVITAGWVIGLEPGSQQNPQGVAIPTQETKTFIVSAAPEPPDPVDPLVRQLLHAARQRFEAQRSYYEEGRISIDRFVMASDRLMAVERLVARKESEALAAMQRHVDRLKQIEERERKELEVGKGTVADVAEINQNRLEAEVMLMKAKEAKPLPDVVALERRLGEVERKLDQILKAEGEKRPVP